MKTLFSSIIINQILICYISCFTYQCGSIIIPSSGYLFKLDSVSEALGMLSRILFGLSIDLIPYPLFRGIYFFSSFSLVISTILFGISLSNNNSELYVLSWFINRVFGSIITATRDYLIYRLSYSMELNIPVFKALKTLGNLITLAHTFLFLTNIKVTTYLIISSSILNLLFTLVTIKVMDRTIKTDKFNKESIVTSKFKPSNLLIVIAICGSTSLFTVSDQITYVESSSIKNASIGRFLGQTVFGLIYALLFKNSIYMALTAPLFVGLSYLSFLQSTTISSFIGCILWGISLTVKNASCIIIPRYLVSNYNQLYQISAFLSESLAVLIASFSFAYMVSVYPKAFVLNIFMIGSFIMFMLLIIVAKLRRKKIAV